MISRRSSGQENETDGIDPGRITDGCANQHKQHNQQNHSHCRACVFGRMYAAKSVCSYPSRGDVKGLHGRVLSVMLHLLSSWRSSHRVFGSVLGPAEARAHS